MGEEKVYINLEGRKLSVPKSAYIKAKTGDLKAFGYTTLTEEQVAKSLEKAISGEADEVIAMFIESDLDKSKYNAKKKNTGNES